jgi:hypothetical protein
VDETILEDGRRREDNVIEKRGKRFVAIREENEQGEIRKVCMKLYFQFYCVV